MANALNTTEVYSDGMTYIDRMFDKLDIARRHIHSAVTLFFLRCDSVSIAALAWTAQSVMWEYHAATSGGGGISPRLRVERRHRETANKLKHAKKDPQSTVKHFDVIRCERATLKTAIALYRNLSKNDTRYLRAYCHWERVSEQLSTGVWKGFDFSAEDIGMKAAVDYELALHAHAIDEIGYELLYTKNDNWAHVGYLRVLELVGRGSQAEINE